MGVIQRIVKPKTHRGKRALELKGPKVKENTKKTIFLKGKNCSNEVTNCMKNIFSLKKLDSVFFNQKHDFQPFEDCTKLEYLTKKLDTSLFAFGTHNKKRPNNLLLGNLFDHQVLDMAELGITNYKLLEDFHNEKITVGTKPCLLFAGEPFETRQEYKRLKLLLLDFFHGEEVVGVRLAGLEHVITFTAVEGVIYMRSYRILLKKSGTRTPRVELEEIGPSFDFELRRTQLSSVDFFKKACRKPKVLKVKTKKNVRHDPFGSKLGKIHMERQHLNKMQIRKMKALRKSGAEKRAEKLNKKKQSGSQEKGGRGKPVTTRRTKKGKK